MLDPRHRSGIVNGPQKTVGREGYETLAPRPYQGAVSLSPLIDDIGTVWEKKKFATVRAPLSIGTASSDFSRPDAPSVTDLPIKMPGTGYRLPHSLQQFAHALQACIDFEARVNPDVGSYYAYLTIDQKYLARGTYQRGEGPHSDGMQGARISPKVPISHGYLCVDKAPTVFYEHPFMMDEYDEDRDYFPTFFRMQADPARARAIDPLAIVFFDAYSVHAAQPLADEGLRTFMRLTFTHQRFDRLGNSKNDAFDYEWDMVPRPIPMHLNGYPG